MAAYSGTVPMTGPIGPLDSRNRYPTHYDYLGLGGYQSVLTETDRDKITSDRRKNGMLVYVVEDDKTYILKENQWEEVKVQVTFKSVDDTVSFDDVEVVKIDTDSGLSFRRNLNEEGSVILSSELPFISIADSDGNEVLSSENQDVVVKESKTIKPTVEGNNISFNTKTFNYTSSSPSVSHTVVHNLGTNMIIVNIYTIQDDGSLDFVIAPYTIKDLNSLEVNLTVGRDIMVNVIPLEPIN